MDIRYRESSAPPVESTGAFLTADDVNELCRRWIEVERERTHALLTELLIQICDNTIPEVVSTLPELRGPTGLAGKLPIVREWTRETAFYEGAVVIYDGGSYQALRDTGEPPDNSAHWERPRCRCAGEQRDELAPPHVEQGGSLPGWRRRSYQPANTAGRQFAARPAYRWKGQPVLGADLNRSESSDWSARESSA
jgi:hypothetical protein